MSFTVKMFIGGVLKMGDVDRFLTSMADDGAQIEFYPQFPVPRTTFLQKATSMPKDVPLLLVGTPRHGTSFKNLEKCCQDLRLDYWQCSFGKDVMSQVEIFIAESHTNRLYTADNFGNIVFTVEELTEKLVPVGRDILALGFLQNLLRQTQKPTSFSLVADQGQGDDWLNT